MAKFNIHDWQAKQWLKNQIAEQGFTPDLEDDDLKRSKIQQIMRKEKMLAKDKGPMVDSSTMNLVSNIDQTWESYEIMTDDLIQFLQAQHDANGSDIVDDWDDLIATLQKELEYFREDEELDEQNVTGTGASVESGDGYAYSTPKWFKKKEPMDEQEEPLPPEEEIEQDVEKLADHPMLDKVNTKDEWEDLVQVVIDMGDEIKAVTPAIMKATLIDAIKNLNKPQ
jgi:hypothetical protein